MIGQDSFILVWMENVTVTGDKKREEEPSIKNLELRIDSRDYVCISGLSGRNKMNFINLLSCSEKPAAGKYLFDYVDIGTLDQKNRSIARRGIGFLFSNLCLVEKMSVYQNIEMPILSRAKVDRDAAIKKAADRMGILELLQRQVCKLTELQQHKVALSRAIVGNPSMIIADEPAESLGQEDGRMVLEMLAQINRSGTAVVSFSEKASHIEAASRHLVFKEGTLTEVHRKSGRREAVL